MADLQRFVQTTIGKSPATRKALAQETLAGINPFKGGELLELAALGVLARESTTTEIVTEGLPQRSKNLIETLLETRPSLGWAHAMAGAWHYEVLRRSSIAARLMGADREQGANHFRQARQSGASDPGIFLLEGISLIYDGQEANLKTVSLRLEEAKAKASSSKGDYARIVARHASALSKIAKDEGMAQLKSAVRGVY